MITPNTLIFLISISIVAVSHFLLLEFYLYWRYEWLDIPMHVFGGAVVAIGIFAACDIGLSFLRRWRKFLPAMALVLLVAVGWEVFQYMVGISAIKDDFVWDTVTDLIWGLLGGVGGFYLASRLNDLQLS